MAWSVANHTHTLYTPTQLGLKIKHDKQRDAIC